MPIIQRIYRKYMANYSGNIKGKLWLIIIQGSQDGGEGSPLSDAEKPAVGPKEPIRSPTLILDHTLNGQNTCQCITLLLSRRKESITWSPFAALGKAASSGVCRLYLSSFKYVSLGVQMLLPLFRRKKNYNAISIS